MTSSSRESPRAPTSLETISGSAPRRVPSTGVPLIIASTRVRPNGSSQSAGIQRHAAPASSSAFRVAVHDADEPNVAGSGWAAIRRPRRWVCPLRLAPSIAQRYPLTRVQPAEKEIVVGLVGTKDELRRVHAVIHEGGAAVPARMIGADEDGVRERSSSGTVDCRGA